MSLPRAPLIIEDQNIILERVQKFLDLCLEPITHAKLRSDDLLQFKNYIIQFHNTNRQNSFSDFADDTEILQYGNPGLLLRLYFPNVQLPETLVKFLQDSTIVIRRSVPLYEYIHRNSPTGLRGRYEHRLSFLGLYLLINFGFDFRAFSVPNKNKIGEWDKCVVNVLRGDDYEIEIIPPKREDLSAILHQLCYFVEFHDYFQLPVTEDYPCRLFNSANLRSKFVTAFANLKNNTLKVIEETNLALVSKLPCPEERLGDNESTIPDTIQSLLAKIPESLKSLFTADTNRIMVTINGTDNSQLLLATILYYQNLLVLSKRFSDVVGANSRDNIYKGEDGPIPPLKSLRAWLYSVLSSASFRDTDDMLVDTLSYMRNNLIKALPLKFYVPYTRYGISYEIFTEIFTENNLQFFASLDTSNINKYYERYNELNKLDSGFLLSTLFHNKEVSSGTSYFIRKFSSSNEEQLKAEFSMSTGKTTEDYLRVKPATFIVPNVPIKTYQYNWKNLSGVIIITPPDNSVPMVGYKRPAYSNHLAAGKRRTTYGFPTVGESIMRPQGGKPSYTKDDFFRRIETIYLRMQGKLYDMSRKELLHHFFIEYPIHNPESTILEVNNSGLSRAEIESLQVDTLAPNPNDSSQMQAVKHLLQSWVAKFAKVNLEIKKYYFELLKKYLLYQTKLVIDQKPSSLPDILSMLETNSISNRVSNIRNNKYPAFNPKSLTPEQVVASAKSPRRYRHKFGGGCGVIESNETLLQGLRPIDNTVANPTRFPIILSENTEIEMIQMMLLQRHGNFPAIYANVGTPTPVNSEGIFQALMTYFFMRVTFRQTLSFITYNETTFKLEILLPYDFKSLYPHQWAHVETSINVPVDPPVVSSGQIPAIPLITSSSSHVLNALASFTSQSPMQPVVASPSSNIGIASLTQATQASPSRPISPGKKRSINQVTASAPLPPSVKTKTATYRQTTGWKNNRKKLYERANNHPELNKKLIDAIVAFDASVAFPSFNPATELTISYKIIFTIRRDETNFTFIDECSNYKVKYVAGKLIGIPMGNSLSYAAALKMTLDKVMLNMDPVNPPATSNSFTIDIQFGIIDMTAAGLQQNNSPANSAQTSAMGLFGSNNQSSSSSSSSSSSYSSATFIPSPYWGQ